MHNFPSTNPSFTVVVEKCAYYPVAETERRKEAMLMILYNVAGGDALLSEH